MDAPTRPEELTTLVSTQQARPLQIIYGATASAVITFFLVLIALVSSGAGGSDDPSRGSLTASVLSLVHLLFGVTVYVVSPTVFRAMCTPKDPAGVGALSLPGLLRALIIRLALMESVALFGLVVCLIALETGALAEEPLYWLNLASGAVFVGFLAATFPTSDRLQMLLRDSTSVLSH